MLRPPGRQNAEDMNGKALAISFIVCTMHVKACLKSECRTNALTPSGGEAPPVRNGKLRACRLGNVKQTPPELLIWASLSSLQSGF
jgi:hypothetical protein